MCIVVCLSTRTYMKEIVFECERDILCILLLLVVGSTFISTRNRSDRDCARVWSVMLMHNHNATAFKRNMYFADAQFVDWGKDRYDRFVIIRRIVARCIQSNPICALWIYIANPTDNIRVKCILAQHSMDLILSYFRDRRLG